MRCIHCDEPNPHPGTRKCSDLHACERRQEYERGIAEGRRLERAAVVAWLRDMCWVSDAQAERIEAGEHKEAS